MATTLALDAPRPLGLTRVIRPYFELTRPRVLLLVLLTGPPVYFAHGAPVPDLWRVLFVLLGIWILGASCSAFNAWIERDSDKLMERTKHRPLPSGRLSARAALIFAAATGVLSTAILLAAGGALAAALGVATLAHYVVIYTLWLKRRSPLNIVIGGAAGAAAPLIADAANGGTLRPFAVFLFAIIFLWTPAHFWSIALLRKAEYAAAGIPMLPSVIGDDATRRRMVAYNVALLLVSVGPVLTGDVGMLYAFLATMAGIGFVWLSVRRNDRAVFFGSLVYLLVVCAAVPLDALYRMVTS